MTAGNSSEGDWDHCGLLTGYGSMTITPALDADGWLISTVPEFSCELYNSRGWGEARLDIRDGANMNRTESSNPPKPFEMIVDRPFLFLIEDQQTKTILFMGVVHDPGASS
jgi:hypothetical protein